jgi:hypothetical protein
MIALFSYRYTNLFTVFGSILRNEGVISLYRGALSSVIGVLPYSGFVFFTYDTLKNIRFGMIKKKVYFLFNFVFVIRLSVSSSY